jgi:hypothetical protein
MPFEDWGLGEELFNDLDKEHDLLDRDVRPFAEECDQLRALQIFTGSDDAWGGFAARYVDRLVDEYGKKAVLVWAIEDGKRIHQVSYPVPNIMYSGAKQLQTTRIKREVNKARSLFAISPQATMYTPILEPPTRLPGTVRLNSHSEWYTSALISMAMESVTLPTRLRPYQQFESLLAGDDSIRRIFELQASLTSPKETNDTSKPARATKVESSEPGSSKVKTKFDLDFTYDSPDGDESHVFNQLQVWRGDEPKEDDKSPGEDLGMLRKMRLYNSEAMFHRWVVHVAISICALLTLVLLGCTHHSTTRFLTPSLTTYSLYRLQDRKSMLLPPLLRPHGQLKR